MEAAELLGFRARRRALAASSDGSSTVSKHEQVCRANLRIWVPSSFVDWSSQSSVPSVCRRSLAKVCHSANVKSNWRMLLLWGLSRSPSKTGIAHYNNKLEYHAMQTDLIIHTCNKSS